MKNHFSFFLLTILAFLSVELTAQVAINNNGDLPDASSALDISSTSKGLLIPRMTTAERVAIDTPANGLIIFDIDTKSVWFYELTTTSWKEIYGSNNNTTLADADGNTKVEVEQTPDENTVSLTMNGTEFFVFDSARIEVLNSGSSVFIGGNAGKKDDYSFNTNVAIGANALSSSISSNSNIAIGFSSMINNTSGDWNVAIGQNTLYDNISGSLNSVIGAQALMNNTTGTSNVAIGMNALFYNTTGDTNVAVGYGALLNNKANSRSTAIGFMAMYNADNWTTGQNTYNTAIGYYALKGSSTISSNSGTKNTAVGDSTMAGNTFGSSNVAFGNSSMASNTWGSQNTALGSGALYSNKSNNGSTAIGFMAMYNADNRTTSWSTFNTAIGYEALKGGSTPASNTGRNNTTLGAYSMSNNTSGGSNVSIGVKSLYANTVGGSNVAVGYNTLSANTTGLSNTAIGYSALSKTTISGGSTAIGNASLDALNSGTNNTAVGENSFSVLSSGNFNLALGGHSATNLTSGSSNIFIGYNTSAPVTTGSNQLNIGNTIYGTGIGLSTYKIGIGTSAPEEELDVRGELQVKNSSGYGKIIVDGTSGNSSLEFRNSGAYGGAFGYNSTNDNLFLYHGGNVVFKNGQLGVGTTTPGYTLQVGNSGDGSSARANAWNTFSDRRWKKNMVVIDHPIEKLNMLNGYYYNRKEGEDPSVQVGVIAQEVEMALPEIVSTDSAGYKSVDYSKITALLIEVNKAQQKQIDDLAGIVEQQNEKIEHLMEMMKEK